jgi:DNA-binding LacI/PurR family transcriptional regulator
MLDIAEVANVSTATVSRVLNGKPGASEEVRQAVLTAMDMLGYERPAILKVKNRGLVGVVVPELDNPVFPAFAQQIESRLSAQGYTALLCTQSPGGTTEEQCVEMLTDQGAGGVIFVSGLHADIAANHDHYRDLRARGIAVAFVNGYAPDIDGTFVATDDVAGVEASVRHLVSLGHERIGLAMGPDRFVPSRRKLESFRNALHQHFGPMDVSGHIAPSLYTVEGGHAAAAQLIDTGHTAIICGSDLMALGAIRAARTAGLDVPDDLSVIGYDDSTMVAFVDPPLTTIHQPVTEMSAAVVAALLGELDGNPGPRTELLFRPELIVRGSTNAAAKTAQLRLI